MPDNNPLQDLLLLRVVAEAGPVQSKARKGLWFVSRGSCNIEVRNMTLIFLKIYINNISRPPYMHIQTPPPPILFDEFGGAAWWEVRQKEDAVN